MYHTVMLVIPMESMNDPGRSLITALELADESKQGLTAASTGVSYGSVHNSSPHAKLHRKLKGELHP